MDSGTSRDSSSGAALQFTGANVAEMAAFIGVDHLPPVRLPSGAIGVSFESDGVRHGLEETDWVVRVDDPGETLRVCTDEVFQENRRAAAT